MPQGFEKGIITDAEVALGFLDRHDKMDGVLRTDDETRPYIIERMNYEGSSGGDYSRVIGRRFLVSLEVVAELRRQKLVEPMTFMGPLPNCLEISTAGVQWLRRQRARKTSDINRF